MICILGMLAMGTVSGPMAPLAHECRPCGPFAETLASSRDDKCTDSRGFQDVKFLTDCNQVTLKAGSGMVKGRK